AAALCADLPVEPITVDTPLEAAQGRRLARPVTLVPILRAGLGLADGIAAVLSEARIGHIGLRRDERTLQAVPYSLSLPADLGSGPALIVDPMVATGGSADHAARVLAERGCRDIRLACLVCAPQGVARMLEHHPAVTLFACALDRQLDARGFILPGLGDAGDRYFGTG
ncbi:MAG TPA: uracil phosphoribosyltransferase, partial [Planctomycetota bacterium]|nr:uracil phosphoribosyltransferase [Planctomycetota bacterium]